MNKLLALLLALAYCSPCVAGWAGAYGPEFHITNSLSRFPWMNMELLYVELDDEKCDQVIWDLYNQDEIFKANDQQLGVEISLFTEHLTLPEYHTRLADPHSRESYNLDRIAKALQIIENDPNWRKPIYIRPLSEMNDDSGPWELGSLAKDSRTFKLRAQQYADVWHEIRKHLMSYGAKNLRFVFSPLAGERFLESRLNDLALQAFNDILKGEIDAFGPTLYARPRGTGRGDSGHSNQDYVSASVLLAPWVKALATSHHRGIPWVEPEFGVSQQGTDAKRAKWIMDALKLFKTRNYRFAIYFDDPRSDWYLKSGSKSLKALNDAMASFGNYRLRK